MKREKLLSEIVHSNYTELSRDAQGHLKGGFGSVQVIHLTGVNAQNNCKCNGNNCNCPTEETGVYNNCECNGNNCNCTTTSSQSGIPSYLLDI